MAIEPVSVNQNVKYGVFQNQNGDKIITYDDPNCIDEERTYTFRKDGSAECKSNAWGTKTELPAGTFKEEDEKVSPEKLTQMYQAYYLAKNPKK